MSNPALTTLVGFGANPKTAIASIDWTALQKVESDGIKSYLRALGSADRGRTRERERTEPGLSEFILDNRDRRFEPEFTGSPYSPNVLPGKPVRHGLGYMPLVVGLTPLLYWRLGESTGATTAVDEMGTFDGTYFGNPALGATGKIRGNTALDADASNDIVETNAFTPALTATGVTFAAWVQGDSFATISRMILWKGSASVEDWALLVTTSGKARFEFVDSGAVTRSQEGATTLAADGTTWYFLVGTWDGTTLRVYVNGVIEGTSGDLSANARRDSGNRLHAAGATGAANLFDGRLDEPAVWDRALSAAEIKALYDEGAKNIQDGWIWHGYMEGWPPSYPAFGKDAVTNAVATDALGTLALEDLISPYALEVLKDPPVGYWRLGEGNVNQQAADLSGNGRNGSYVGTPSFNTAGPMSEGSAITCDASEDGLTLPASASFSLPVTGSFVGSIEFWLKAAGGQFPDIFLQGDFFGNSLQVHVGSAGKLFWTHHSGTGFIERQSSIAVNDGAWHHCVITWADKDATLVHIYIDSTLRDGTTLQDPMTPSDDIPRNSPVIGQTYWVSDNDFSLSELALYAVALSSSRIAAHWDARTLWANDKGAVRIGKVLDAISWPAADRDLDTGQSQIQAQDEKTNALSHVLDVAGWESGYFFPAKDGKLRYDDRHARLKSPLNTSQATFAWSPSGSEKPVRGAQLDFHLRNVKNYIVVERINGTTAVAQDSTSITNFGKRKETRTTKVTSDSEALSDAQWTKDHKRNPLYEIEFLEIRPASDDNLWTQVISREIGDRITLILRPPGGGAQLSKDFHIEHIHHECTTPTTKEWLTRWRLSPAENQTYWIVEHATYGKVEQTTRVAW